MISDEEIELIEKYQRGELKDGALSAFEERVVLDEAFAHEVNAYSTIMAGVKLKGEEDFTETIKRWEQEEKNEVVDKPSIPLRRLWSAAAAVLILVLPLSLWFYTSSQHSNERHFDAYFQPYEDIVTSRSAAPKDDAKFREGMAYYNNSDYVNAVRAFEVFLVSQPEHAAAIFYLGVANLASDNPKKAELQFLKLQQQPEGVFTEMADWYLALAYVEENKVAQADAVLKNIVANPKHAFVEEAKSLQKELNKE